jgi:hypothetical protein
MRYRGSGRPCATVRVARCGLEIALSNVGNVVISLALITAVLAYFLLIRRRD